MTATVAPTVTGSPTVDIDGRDHPVAGGRDRVLHLHRLDDDHDVTRGDRVARGDGDLDHGALHGCDDGAACPAGRGVTAGRPPDPRGGRRTGRRRRNQFGRQRHDDAAAVDLRDDLPTLAAAARAGLRRGLGRRVRLEAVVELGLDPPGMDPKVTVSGHERRVPNDRAVERQHCRDALDHDLVQRSSRSLQRLGAVGAGDDQLREHRVEGARYHRPGNDSRVEPHAGPGGRDERSHRARGGQERAPGILRVDPKLDAVAAGRQIGAPAQLLTRGDAKLLAHQVDCRSSPR